VTEDAGKSRIPSAEALELAGPVEYGEHAVVSRTLVKNEAGSVTLFAFDRDQSLSEHTAPFDALVQVMEGEGAPDGQFLCFHPMRNLDPTSASCAQTTVMATLWMPETPRRVIRGA